MMTTRIAAVFALIVFTVCMVIGGLQAGNPFVTTVSRALVAMAGTYIIGLIIGTMARKMLEENLKVEEEKLRNTGTEEAHADR
jgi:hypothetical protein